MCGYVQYDKKHKARKFSGKKFWPEELPKIPNKGLISLFKNSYKVFLTHSIRDGIFKLLTSAGSDGLPELE